ncbi:MAG TPA: hypothetical protein VH062_23900 [Polyangiaceae bacterium]|nr:hypothetical protein [Polyangiaceae bacterium]
MARGALSRHSVVIAAVLGTAFAGCETRSVFLVPHAQVSAGGSAVIHLPDAGSGGRKVHVDAGSGGGGASAGGDVSTTDTGAPRNDDGGDVACETTRNQQIPQPLGVYVIVDQSNAMLQKWDAVSAGLQTFISGSDELGGVSVGIQYYALSPATSSPDPYLSYVCDWHSYVNPDIPIAGLPTNQQPLLGSIANHGPLSLVALFNNLSLALTLTHESPIDSAIEGAVQGARDWMTANAAQQPAAVVLLVTNQVASSTDSPNCLPSAEKAAIAASAGIINTPTVPTYVLAVGGPNEDLDAIARAGGTNAAYPVTNGADVLANLISIRQAFLPCDVSVSVTDQDLTQDKLNVELSQGKASERYYRVPSASDCSANTTRGEWYVESNGTDSKVRLCPRTCETVRAVSNATLDIVRGCRTRFVPQ